MKKLMLIVSLLLSTNSYAEWSTGTGEVTRVYSHDGAHVIRTTITDGVCTPGAFWWPADDSDAQDMFTIALTGLMSTKKIQVSYDSTNLDCQHGGSVKITHMVIFK